MDNSLPAFVPTPGDGLLPPAVEHACEHACDCVAAGTPGLGEQGLGLGAPLLPLVAQAAGFVLVGAGLEVGLLGQRQGLDAGGDAAVVGLEGLGELALPVGDVAAAGGPRLEQAGVEAVDLADRAAALGAGSVDEPDAEPVGELGLEAGVVVLGGHDLGLEQHPPVEGEPLARPRPGGSGPCWR